MHSVFSGGGGMGWIYLSTQSPIYKRHCGHNTLFLLVLIFVIYYISIACDNNKCVISKGVENDKKNIVQAVVQRMLFCSA